MSVTKPIFIFALLFSSLWSEEVVYKNVAEHEKTEAPSTIRLPLSVLYPTELANPRQVAFAGAIRWQDSVGGRVSSPVTFGIQFPLYRWLNVGLLSTTGDIQFEIEGAVFGIFTQSGHNNTLVNTEYYVGLPLTYAYGNWAHRLRVYHISSHLGDEYVKTHKNFKRLNKSFEAFDYSLSYMITDDIRVYVGPGSIIHSDSEMRLKPLYIQYGMDIHLNKIQWKELYGRPFLSMHFENAQDTKWKMDATFAIGYEWGRSEHLGRKVRLALQYHSGFSQDGQFSRKHNDYVQLIVSYGF